MVIKYIGRTTDFKGKTVWEIVGNLKNFGVGRILIRSKFQRYPEPTYFRILKVQPQAATEDEYNSPRKVTMLVERVFRGEKFDRPVQMDSTTYKPDYILIPKNKEHLYTTAAEAKEKIFPKTIDLPPLLQQYIKRTTVTESGKTVPEEDLKCELRINKKGLKHYRFAEEGEEPNVQITLGLGKPASPNLYANVHFKL